MAGLEDMDQASQKGSHPMDDDLGFDNMSLNELGTKVNWQGLIQNLMFCSSIYYTEEYREAGEEAEEEAR